MTNLTELEQTTDREARHGHRELVAELEARLANAEAQFWKQMERAEKAEARVAELEARNKKLALELMAHDWEYDTAWNAAIRAAADEAFEADDCYIARNRIRALLRNEGSSDDQ